MTCPWSGESGVRSAVHVILIGCLVHTIVLAAPPPIAPPQPAERNSPTKVQTIDGKSLAATSVPVGSSAHKTADLVPLINETLRINNKTTTIKGDEGPAGPSEGGKQSFRDDWTFDRVEYDLMEFLQELNARYQTNTTAAASPVGSLEDRRDHLVPSIRAHQSLAPVGESKVSKKTIGADCQRDRAPTASKDELVTTSTVEQAKKELDEVSPTVTPAAKLEPESKSTSTPPGQAPAVTLPASSELPISLASGDHDISESTWQYGIFDRFTRPRASTTSTPSPAEALAASATNPNLDVRSFNSDECGLRNYRPEPDYFPSLSGAASSQLDTDEISKELSQRRQRPPLGSSFFSSHKKYHLTATGDVARDELDRKPESPPYDRYGEPASASNLDQESKYPTEKGGAQGASTLVGDNDSPPGDSEFNLALRRQWLQQQLGSTLQILGYNGTAGGGGNGGSLPPSVSDYFNRTSLGARENMMKMSADGFASGNKLARSYKPASQAASQPLAGVAATAAAVVAPALNERELKARQDELKLEARVIGGNDARLGDSPWSASLQALVSRPGTGNVEYRHYCGGTIISEHYILTAAHCLDFMVGRESRLFVVIGDLNWRMSAASLHGRRFGIEKLIIHGGYKSTAFGHDIGLIRTKESMRPLKVNGRYIINSVCLPERNVEHSGEAELVGWGLFSNRNEMADSLQIADVPILPRPLCVDLYRRRTGLIQWLIGIELITEKQICAGTFGRGICQGDSGSALVFNEKVRVAEEAGPGAAAAPEAPLLAAPETQPDGKADIRRLLRNQLVRDQQQRATIIGTVAFGGIRRCSYQSLPGVYMQTSKYLDWILPRIQT